MKIISTSFLLLLLGIASLTSCGSSEAAKAGFPTPISYNDAIIGEQTKIIENFLALANIAGTEEFAAKRTETLNVCDESIKKVSAMPAYEENTEFRDAALGLFKFYKKIIEKEFNDMNTLLLNPDFDTESLNQITEMQTKIAEEEKGYDDRMQKAQQDFASKHGFGIEKNSLQDKIDAM